MQAIHIFFGSIRQCSIILKFEFNKILALVSKQPSNLRIHIVALVTIVVTINTEYKTIVRIKENQVYV